MWAQLIEAYALLQRYFNAYELGWGGEMLSQSIQGYWIGYYIQLSKLQSANL